MTCTVPCKSFTRMPPLYVQTWPKYFFFWRSLTTENNFARMYVRLIFCQYPFYYSHLKVLLQITVGLIFANMTYVHFCWQHPHSYLPNMPQCMVPLSNIIGRGFCHASPLRFIEKHVYGKNKYMEIVIRTIHSIWMRRPKSSSLSLPCQKYMLSNMNASKWSRGHIM